MKTLATILLFSILFGVICLIDFILSYGSCVSTTEVLQWWWKNGSGHTAIIFFGFGFFAFALLINTWLMVILQIIYGKPVTYVWVGSALFRDTDYYYDLMDSKKTPFTVKKRVGEYGFNFTTTLDVLYTCHHMLRYGSRPETAERLLAHNLKSQLMLVIFQYPALAFGSISLYEILSQHAALYDGSTISYDIFIVIFLGLIPIYILGLIIGHLAFQRKKRSFNGPDYQKIKMLKLLPGDLIDVRLMQNGRKRHRSGNKPFNIHYRGEWIDDDGISISVVFGFKAVWSIKDIITQLDTQAKNKSKIPCVVMDDFTLRPKVLMGHKNLTML